MTQGTTHRTAPHKLANIAKGPSDRQKDSQTIDAWPRVATFMKIERVVKHFIHLNPRKLESERGLQTVLPKKRVPPYAPQFEARKHLVFFRLLKLPAMAFYDLSRGRQSERERKGN